MESLLVYMEIWKKLLIVAIVVAFVAAYFLLPRPQPEPELIVLQVNVEGKGSIDYNGKLKDTQPFNVTLIARPSEHWQFKHWVLNGTKVVEDSKIYLVVRANSTLKAVFEEELKFKITVILKGNGTCIVGNSTWYKGEKLNIGCTPAEGWILANTTLNGEKVELPAEVIMNRDHRLEVFFKKVVEQEVKGKYTLRVVSNAENALAVVGGDEVSLPHVIGSNKTRHVKVEGVW